jgi:hypothetical protein
MTNRSIPRHACLEQEWTARPPGRLGRRLLADIESYLGFFAVARSGDRERLQPQQTNPGGRT